MRVEERETYRLLAGHRPHRQRVDTAASTVAAALAAIPGEWGVGVSGGKDSTALLHLCHAAGWRGRAFHFRFRETPTENTEMAHALAARFATGIVDVLVPGDFDVFDEVGHFFAIPTTAEERAAVARNERRYKAAAEAAAVHAGFAGLFWGMRKDESRARRITLARFGRLYRAKARTTWTCCPLADWSGADVWAYTLASRLPWLPVYDAETGQDRERARSETTWLGFPELWRRGQGRRLREGDPARWSELCRRWPDLRYWG